MPCEYLGLAYRAVILILISGDYREISGYNVGCELILFDTQTKSKALIVDDTLDFEGEAMVLYTRKNNRCAGMILSNEGKSCG